MFDEFVGKAIYLTKKDGYIRKGTLLETSTNFIKIQFFDGRTEYIAISEINTIRENGVGQ